MSGCKATADVAFLVDSSGSIGRSRWPLMIEFVKKVTNVFNVGPDGTHIAVIAYSTNAKLEFTFNTLSGAQITAEEYGNLIDKIGFQRGFTYIDKALIMADEQVFTSSAGMRPGVSQVSKRTALCAWLLKVAAVLDLIKIDSVQPKIGPVTPIFHADSCSSGARFQSQWTGTM